MTVHGGSPAKTADLARVLSAALDGGIAVRKRRPFPYRSTFPLEEVEIQTGDGVRKSLVFKDLSRRGPADPAWRVKASFLHDPLREIEVYRDVLAPRGLTSPECVAIEIDPDQGRYWLFLERADGEILGQIGDPEAWRSSARWLAGLHACFAGHTDALPSRLLVYGGEYYHRWIDRARRFARWPAAVNGSHRSFDWFAGRCQEALDWLVDQPVTLLHGEYYPSNIVIERDGDALRVRPVDWEMAGVGSGLLDLAALCSGAWGEPERETLAAAYREALPAEVRPPAGALHEGLDRCRLLLAVQWLGWSDDWTPPAEHAHDWLATALELAEMVQA